MSQNEDNKNISIYVLCLSLIHIYSLATTCEQLPRLRQLSSAFQSAELAAVLADMDDLADIKELILSAIDEEAPASLKDGGVIKIGYNSEVDELRDIRCV